MMFKINITVFNRFWADSKKMGIGFLIRTFENFYKNTIFIIYIYSLWLYFFICDWTSFLVLQFISLIIFLCFCLYFMPSIFVLVFLYATCKVFVFVSYFLGFSSCPYRALYFVYSSLSGVSCLHILFIAISFSSFWMRLYRFICLSLEPVYFNFFFFLCL